MAEVVFPIPTRVRRGSYRHRCWAYHDRSSPLRRGRRNNSGLRLSHRCLRLASVGPAGPAGWHPWRGRRSAFRPRTNNNNNSSSSSSSNSRNNSSRSVTSHNTHRSCRKDLTGHRSPSTLTRLRCRRCGIPKRLPVVVAAVRYLPSALRPFLFLPLECSLPSQAAASILPLGMVAALRAGSRVLWLAPRLGVASPRAPP